MRKISPFSVASNFCLITVTQSLNAFMESRESLLSHITLSSVYSPCSHAFSLCSSTDMIHTLSLFGGAGFLEHYPFVLEMGQLTVWGRHSNVYLDRHAPSKEILSPSHCLSVRKNIQI